VQTVQQAKGYPSRFDRQGWHDLTAVASPDASAMPKGGVVWSLRISETLLRTIAPSGIGRSCNVMEVVPYSPYMLERRPCFTGNL